jgi:hypothetical protein
MAWKMLDIARVIYEKQDSHSIEEVDVITALADVSLERGITSIFDRLFHAMHFTFT